jgi:predicted amidohydrolase YtcJ
MHCRRPCPIIVYLTRVDGHAALVNAAAMQLAG